MSQLNQMKKKNNIIVYRVKNNETGLYYKRTNYIRLDHRDPVTNSYYKNEHVFDAEGHLFNTELGARKRISEITGKSFTKYSKMTSTEKILKGAEVHSKFEIKRTKVTFKDID